MPSPTGSRTLERPPSLDPATWPDVAVSAQPPGSATVLGYLVSADGSVPASLGLDRAALTGAGFTGAAGSTLVVPAASGPVRVAVGVGPSGSLDAAGLRNAAG